MPQKRRGRGLVQQIRDAIEDSGLTLGELSKRSGVATSQLSYFLRGERTLTLPAAERLCDALGYQLFRVPPAEPPRRGRKPKAK